MSTTSETLTVLFHEQGISHKYSDEDGIILITGNDLSIAMGISDYAVSDADLGMQDSELIAEAIRNKANYPRGKNKVARAIAKKYL